MEEVLRITRTCWLLVVIAGLLALLVALPASAQTTTANVELRVWQRIADPLRIYVSARPEGGSWNTLGTIPLALSGRSSSGTFRYGDITPGVPLPEATPQDSTANVELRVWQRILDPLRIYVSARPEGGSWNTLGTIPLALSGQSSSGTFRYGDITLGVPMPLIEEAPPALEMSRPLADTQNLRWLQHYHVDLYRRITALPWVSNGVTEMETTAVDNLLYIGVGDIDNLRSILNLRWARDDLTTTEANAIEWVYWLSYASAEDAAKVISIPWFQDAVTETEAEAIRSLAWLADEDGARGGDIIKSVLATRWFGDGISETEHDLLLWLAYLEYESEEAAVTVVDMPFLSSIDREDVLALRALHRLAYYSRDGRLDAVLDHPDLPDGITDHETTLVAATGTLRGASEVRRILAPGNARIEVVREKTRHTPNLKISIIRTGTLPRQATIDDIRASVEFVEGVMNRPLPVSHIIVVVDDHAITEGYGGTNYGFAFSVLSGDEQYETPYEAFNFRSKILHEAAHFFWRGHASWIDEGVANTFEYLYGVDAGVSPGLLKKARRDGCEAHNLEMLTEWDSSLEEQGRYGCNYFLGQLLFQELLDELGGRAFSQRLRELYRLSLKTKNDSQGETPGIAEVREAFPNQAAVLDEHWSGALNAPESRAAEEGVPRLSHGLIAWDQYPTYDGVFVTFSGTLLDEAILTNETLADARSGGYSNFTVTSANGYDHLGASLPPLNAGQWILDDPGDAVATNYQLEQRTFTVRFRYPKALGEPSDYVVLVWGFQDTAETPFFGGIRDVLGYARFRVE